MGLVGLYLKRHLTECHTHKDHRVYMPLIRSTEWSIQGARLRLHSEMLVWQRRLLVSPRPQARLPNFTHEEWAAIADALLKSEG